MTEKKKCKHCGYPEKHKTKQQCIIYLKKLIDGLDHVKNHKEQLEHQLNRERARVAVLKNKYENTILGNQ